MDDAADVMADLLAAEPGAVAVGDRPLLVGTGHAGLLSALRATGAAPVMWSRRLSPGIAPEDVAPWPPSGPFSAALVRLPKAKAELDLALDAVASRLGPGAPIALVGGNDEGIRSAGSRLARYVDEVDTVAARRHCRMLLGRRAETIEGLVGTLAGWRMEGTIDLGDGLRPWIAYPGLFAGGRLDDGTRLLIAAMRRSGDDGPVLDFAAGTGVVAATWLARHPGAAVDLLDSDALALAASRENVPSARALRLGSGLPAADPAGYSDIVSNPPIHVGVAEDHEVLERLIAGAPDHLRSERGSLQLVVQRRVKVRRLLEAAFASVDVLADDGRFTVWRATSRRRSQCRR